MQASRSTRFAPFSFVASSASNHAPQNTSRTVLQTASRTPSQTVLRTASQTASLSASRNALSQPTIAGDVCAVVVWAAMVPGFMWLGTVMGL